MARFREIRAHDDDGVATAEYAVATVAACSLGGVLVKVLSSPTVTELLLRAVRNAFRFAF